MANKQLTARVKLNTTDFDSKIKRMARAIDAINNAVGKQSNAYNAVNRALGKTDNLTEKVDKKTKQAKTSTEQWANALKKVNNKLNSSDGALGKIWNKLKGLAATYLGIMGARAVIDTSDAITSAENKLNYVSAQQLGNEKAFTKGSNGNEIYSKEVLDTTEKSLDKIYAAAQRSRSVYTDMIANVSKSMTLAPDAFQNNIDNAVRFQEIMAEAYTVGGATAQEMSSSMYQMMQALGGNLLAGDELRSVREGAPLAYKEIEKFAQGVYNTSDSLKDMAADGLITSDIVVSAIMNAGDKIDSAFEKTDMTFAQMATRIKNTAVRAFQPVLQKLNDLLNSEKGKKAIEGIEKALVGLANVASSVFNTLVSLVAWIADNWNWLKHVIIGTLMLMITWTLIKTGISLACTFLEMAAYMKLAGVQGAVIKKLIITISWIAVIVLAVMALVYVFYLWKQGAISTCDAIVSALIIVGIAVAIIGLILGGWIMVIVGLAIAAIGLIIKYLDYFLAIVYSIGAGIYNIVIGVINGIIQNFYSLFVEPIAGLIEWFVNAFTGGFDGIAGAFKNLCGQLLSFFIGFAKPFTKIWDAITGMSTTDAIENAQNKLKNWGKTENAVIYKVEAPELKRIKYTDAWNTGMKHGDAAKNWMNNVGAKYQTAGSNASNKVGINGLPDPNNPNYAIKDAYAPLSNDDLKNIAGDTSDIKNSVDISKDDMDYLRKIADMEWRNEFTTAEIKVDMTNHNTVNGDNDLDGIVSHLSEVLKEEMTNVAYGVY